MRIAMWSGPRNLSTAMMYSFGNRPDFLAMDEPFYAAYLHATGEPHPMHEEIITAHQTDPQLVAKECMRAGAPHIYMKHMPHHMIDGFPLSWAEDCVHIHLIRHPARVMASYAAKRDKLSFDDVGFEQQQRFYEKFGGVVIDSADIRDDPEGMLRKLCATIDLPFDPAMLSWPAGPRTFDGIWAKHWYHAVHESTGFAGAEGPLPDVDTRFSDVLDHALPIYNRMYEARLK
ncbi:putative branched-chain amino acid aminotransferase [Sulfitobacter noctilucicola]|uniref:Sulfotransferase family protein n=1 Tax=Sulfitobacter noctilucicola TaxID=1342301 RepID=A0A7W6Q2K9_9RHOB|nr:hypothetical protein [Sulfitobacter noctilucicola]KIN62811.1 putative branched-chain amino acid aminotransferase [Sulfitobacter noctilucicola]MBB4172658.1 hypothetical protein [Sulfitobacter noctilucicola]